MKVNSNKLKLLLDILTYVIISLIILLLFFKINFKEVVVSGPSMSPYLSNLEYGYTDRFLFRVFGLDRYDIVVVNTQDDDLFIKRVIGLPNETIQIIDGKVYINDKLLEDDNYCDEVILNPGIASEKILLGKNEYFVMGDNRNNSLDSRNPYLGVVKYSQIYGHAFISRAYCVDTVCEKIYDKHDYEIKGW